MVSQVCKAWLDQGSVAGHWDQCRVQRSKVEPRAVYILLTHEVFLLCVHFLYDLHD